MSTILKAALTGGIMLSVAFAVPAQAFSSKDRAYTGHKRTYVKAPRTTRSYHSERSRFDMSKWFTHRRTEPRKVRYVERKSWFNFRRTERPVTYTRSSKTWSKSWPWNRKSWVWNSRPAKVAGYRSRGYRTTRTSWFGDRSKWFTARTERTVRTERKAYRKSYHASRYDHRRRSYK